MTPWKGKRARLKQWHRDRTAAMEQFVLVSPTEAMALYERGKQDNREEVVRRLRGWLDGLSGIVIGPYGEKEVECVTRAIAVVEAERFTSPRELTIREWNRRARDTGVGGFVS